MDIYKFFHPHHNPKLHTTHLRQQELCELEQAASELRKALERAKERSRRRPRAPIMPEHFGDIIKAMHFVERSLQTLSDAHPGDAAEDLNELISERTQTCGWESWAMLLKEQLETDNGLIKGPTPQGHDKEISISDSPIQLETTPID